MQLDPSESAGGDSEDAGPYPPVPNLPDSRPTASEKASLWSKAKGALGDVPTHASKIATIGTASAVRTAELGKQSLSVAADATRGVIEGGKNAYAGSTLAAAIDRLDDHLDKSGAKKLIADSAGAAVAKLDQVTGKRLVELLEEKLRAQDVYNNVLATRLAEALERIAKLEAQLKHDN